MKKVGIVTFHWADNFGAVLQNYALQKTIEKLDIEVEDINYIPQQLVKGYGHELNLFELIKEYGIKIGMKSFLYRLYIYKNIENRRKVFEKFRKEKLSISKKIYKDEKSIYDNPPNYDYYITGSDQVWGPDFYKKSSGIYFLNFINNKGKKIAYAASLAEKVPADLISDYKKYVNQFDSIAIREKSGKEFIKTITEKNVEVTLDPTLLLKMDEWSKIAKVPSITEKYILVYDLEYNENVIEIVNEISEKTGIKVINFSNVKKYKNVFGTFLYDGPEEFLGYFKNAEMIITNSFHGTVFSILFNKIFFTIPHTTRGSRMIDLLNELQLNERIIYKKEEIVTSDIDYVKVEELLEKIREKSVNYLKESLK